jgi:hypothetical protein
LNASIRFSQRNHRYSVSESLLAVLYPILLGLGRIETTRLLKPNGVSQYLTGLPVLDLLSTVEESWRLLTKAGEAAGEALGRLLDSLFLWKPQGEQPAAIEIVEEAPAGQQA